MECQRVSSIAAEFGGKNSKETATLLLFVTL
jgi:hypothetical protein